MTLAGTAGNSNLTLNVGSGTVILSQSNGNAAAAIANVAAGSTVQLGGANQIASSGSVTLGGGTFDLNTYSAAVSGLFGTGTIDTVAGGTPTLTIGSNNGSSTFGGTIQNSAGALSLTKTAAACSTLPARDLHWRDDGQRRHPGAGRRGHAGRHGRQRQRRRGSDRQRQHLHRAGGSLTVAGGTSPRQRLDLRDVTINTLAVNGNLALGSGSGGSVLDFD